MAVLVYTESENGKFKKNAFEVASYAAEVAKQLGTSVTAVSINASDNESLGTYGVSKVLNVSNDTLNTFNAKAYANTIVGAAQKEGAQVVVVSSSTDTKFLAPILAAKLAAGYVPNVVAAPESVNPFTVKRTAFSNKGFAHTQITTDTKLVGVSNNAFGVIENATTATVEDFECRYCSIRWSRTQRTRKLGDD